MVWKIVNQLTLFIISLAFYFVIKKQNKYNLALLEYIDKDPEFSTTDGGRG